VLSGSRNERSTADAECFKGEAAQATVKLKAAKHAAKQTAPRRAGAERRPAIQRTQPEDAVAAVHHFETTKCKLPGSCEHPLANNLLSYWFRS
jgi:hypothetical protein